MGPMTWSYIQVSNMGNTIKKVKGSGKARKKKNLGMITDFRGATGICFLFLSAVTFVFSLKRGIVTHAKVLWSCARAVLQRGGAS